MPVETLTPGTIGTWDQQPLRAGSDKPTSVQTNDGDTTGLQTVNADQKQTFLPSALPGGINKITTHRVGSLTRRVTAWDGNQTSTYNMIRIAGVDYESGAHQHGTSPSYIDYYDDDLGAAEISLADIPTVEFGARMVSNYASAKTMYATQYYWTITYTAAKGSKKRIVRRYCLPWIGLALGLEHLPAIAGFVRKSGGPLILPREYEETLAEWREWIRRPRVFDLCPKEV